jgi:acyl carrier protein
MHQSRADIETRVLALVANKLDLELHEITRNATFMGDLGADSLDTVQLTFEFEKEFGITISDEKAEKLRTVGDAIDCIQAALKP